ncbi:hypothetical protein QMZ05_21835 [Bradyrhizobium sp. INPA03-11B]|uniref:hypothetical protein n=1 Tax=Bradyrhizobium sp. INPA03-11B TaxID=418598 RepID=UPI00338EC691
MSHKMISISVAAVLNLAITPALAGDLPDYPVETWCSRVSSISGAKSEMLYGGCIDQEQAAYDSLKKSWSTLPQQTREWCSRVASSTGGGSYMLLKGCVDQESDARQQNSSRRFQR